MKATRSVAIAALLLCVQLFFPLQIFAEAAPTPSPSPRNLDLSSTATNVTATHSGTITYGGTQHQVSQGASITAAESVALSHVFHNNGVQSIVLGAQGNAIGGSLNLGYAARNGASALVIPQNVTGIQDAAKLQTLSVTGNLINAGVIQVLSQSVLTNSANIFGWQHYQSANRSDRVGSSDRGNPRFHTCTR